MSIPASKIGLDENKLRPEDRAVHDWYRFVLSFPPHLVRAYVDRFGIKRGDCVLDPFCGTGTTLVECKKLGLRSVGIEPNPMACFASGVKVNWSVSPDDLIDHAREVEEAALHRLAQDGIDDQPTLPPFRSRNRGASILLSRLPEEASELLLRGSISPLALHKTLVLLGIIRERADKKLAAHELLAFARTVVFEASNLQFGPEVGVGPPKPDAAVVGPWLRAVATMANDIRELRSKASVPAAVHQVDARHPVGFLEPESVDAVITSPPYPNEKDYTRTTRLESVLLGLIRNRRDLRALKQNLVRSNTRNVYRRDDDDQAVARHDEIQRIAETIERRRIRLGKTSGFERLYARVTKLYFGGMTRHLTSLRPVLRPGARLAYVVGDQASYLRVMIRTGHLIADLAQSLGYEVEGSDLFRTRLATATKAALREEVVVLSWPGRKT